MTVLKELARHAIRFGLKPEDIGPDSIFADLEYMRGYIRHIRGFDAPASYGVTDVHREWARREWRKLITKVRAKQAPAEHSSSRSPTVRPLESGGQAIHVKSEDERDDSNA